MLLAKRNYAIQFPNFTGSNRFSLYKLFYKYVIISFKIMKLHAMTSSILLESTINIISKHQPA